MKNITKAVRENYVSVYLDASDIARLSTCSHTFYAECRNLSYWRDKLLDAGCNSQLLDEVIKCRVIQNYGNLYQKFMMFSYTARIFFSSLWELLCLSGEPDAIRYAIQNKIITSDTKDYWGDTPLHNVAWSGSLLGLQTILTMPNLNLNAQADQGWTALHHLVSIGSFEVVDYLLQQDVNPFLLSQCGQSILHMAAQNGSIAIIEHILKLGLNPLQVSRFNVTLFHEAAASGSVAAIERILAIEGMHVELKSANGKSAFHFAAESGSLSAIEKLLKIPRIDPLAKKYDGTSALHIAIQKGHLASIERIMQIEGMDLLARSDDGKTPLHFAILSDSPKVISRILQIAGIDPLVKLPSEETILHFAIKNASLVAFKYLMSLSIKDLDFFAVDSKNETLLHKALTPEAVLYLRRIAHHLNPRIDFLNMKNTDNETALDLVGKRKYFREQLRVALTLPIRDVLNRGKKNIREEMELSEDENNQNEIVTKKARYG